MKIDDLTVSKSGTRNVVFNKEADRNLRRRLSKNPIKLGDIRNVGDGHRKQETCIWGGGECVWWHERWDGVRRGFGGGAPISSCKFPRLLPHAGLQIDRMRFSGTTYTTRPPSRVKRSTFWRVFGPGYQQPEILPADLPPT